MKIQGRNTVSVQTVAVSVPNQPKTAPMVALIQPNQPAAILSGPVAGGGNASPGKPAAGVPASTSPTTSVVIRTVEVETMGSFYVTGKAAPGSLSRVYLNGASVAAVTADSKGLWSLQINKGMKPGHYAVRVDQVDTSGTVTGRAEVPFDYPVQVATAVPRIDLAKKKSVVIGSAENHPASAEGGGSVAGTEPQTAGAPGSVSRPGVAAGEEPTRPVQPGPAGGDTQVDQAGRELSKSVGQQSQPEATAATTAGRMVAAAHGIQPNSPATSAPGPTAASPAAINAAGGHAPTTSNDDDVSEPTVVAELVTAKVIRGDSLWRISRNMLGHGVRYTQIYAANTQQIRDPGLIYPGQVFVMPQIQ